MLRVTGLKKSFGIDELFHDVSFEVARGDKVGFVGANGAGKTTLMRCLLGQEETDGGTIQLDEAATIGYVEQQADFGTGTLYEEFLRAFDDVIALGERKKALEKKIAVDHAEETMKAYSKVVERFELLGGYDYESRIRRVAFGLGFTEEDFEKNVAHFSGGQKTRINLAKALVRRPDYLFLDEPTNHLDVDMLEWLESYLLSYGGGILIVSHDRYFLDRVATGILELSHGKVTKYKGNYSRYVEQHAQQQKALEKAYKKQQEHIHETEEYIRKYKAGIKAKQARGRQSQLDRLERIEWQPEDESLHFNFKPVEECGQKVLVLDKVSGGFADRQLFDHLSLLLRRGEAASLIGPNGTGKTTLIRMIMGEKEPTDGHITLGSRVHIGYFAQEHTDLHGAWTVLDEIMNDFSYGEEEARSVLGRFMFRGDDVFKVIDSLSGGEQARLALLKLFLQGPNFLILDEPTNHLDIPTREVLEQALLDFGGTYLVVSHDRYFLDKITQRTLVLEHKQLTEYVGNYSYYREKVREAQEAAEKVAAEAQGSSQAQEKAAAPAVKKAEPAPAVKAPAKAPAYGQAAKLEKIEMKIAELEATIKMYEVQMNMPQNQTDADAMMELTKEYEAAQAQLDEAYEKWEALSES